MSTPGIAVQTNGTTASWDGTAGDDAFEGSSIAEIFLMGLGNDVVMAGGGADVIYADLGKDWFDGGRERDRIDFSYVAGVGFLELPEFGVKFDLAKTTQNLGYWGTKTIYSIEDLGGTPNADKLYGNSGSNRIYGNDGDDFINGRAGADTIEGDLDKDTIVGGTGRDILAGHGQVYVTDHARDIFRYTALSETGRTSSTRDTIWGTFGGANGDKIDLEAIDANGSASGNGTFKFIGTGSFHSNSDGEIQVRPTGNSNEYLVKIDTDTDSNSEASILVKSLTALVKEDFIL